MKELSSASYELETVDPTPLDASKSLLGVTKTKQFSLFFSTIMKIRIKSPIWYVLILGGIFMSAFAYLITRNPIKATEVLTPNITEISGKWEELNLLLQTSEIDVGYAPNDTFTKNFLNGFFPGYEKLQPFPSRSELEKYLKTKNESNYGIYLAPNYSVTLISSSDFLEQTYVQPTFVHGYFQYLYENIKKIKMNVKSMGLAHYTPAVSQSTVISLFLMGMIFPIFSDSQIFYQLNVERIFFMLRMYNLSELVKHLALFLASFIEQIPVTVLTVVFTCCTIEDSKGTDITLDLVVTLLTVLSIICIFFVFAPLLKSTGSISGFLLFQIFVTIVFMILISFESNIPKEMWIVLSVLFPQGGFTLINLLMQAAKKDGEPLSWSNLGFVHNKISGTSALLCIIGNFIFYSILAFWFTLMNPQAYGRPLIGWRNMFKSEVWRALFGKPKVLNIDDPEEAIRFEHLTKIYGGRLNIKAVDDVSLSIKPGEIVVTIGPNGSGKTTLINSLIGSFPITEGNIFFFGEPIVNDFSFVYRSLGVVFQENCFIKDFTVKEMIQLFDRFTGKSEKAIERDIQYYLSALELAHCAGSKTQDLSGGQKRKLQLILALLKSPSIIILDELTAGVDAQSRQLIQKVLENHRDSTVLMTTHSLEESESFSSQIIVMQHGHISFSGTAAEMRNKYKCGYNITFIGGEPNMERILELVRSIVAEAVLDENNQMTVSIPSDLRVADVLEMLEQNKESLGFEKYNVMIESLEDTMRKIIETDELEHQEH
ncbi:ABC transporter family protein [Histomonas meleagridis]|uniref:ABC transporter family protein n=1 Tax=Histomonas meleagridis TaxID=135588 RepID=UPI00355982FC|nr:ABC transporter family protein [Histomonas meleagridis]KAH0800433.1 ABC transporter family protein [Histomonas meleagridis]